MGTFARNCRPSTKRIKGVIQWKGIGFLIFRIFVLLLAINLVKLFSFPKPHLLNGDTYLQGS